MALNANDPLVKNLIDFGLSEKEAKIYITLLELEIATANEIAEKADINRSSAYVVLESLKKKGLASLSGNVNVQQYVATNPEVLLHSARNLTKKQLDIEEKINTVVPDLKALFKGTKKKPKVRVFDGKEGLIIALSETLKSKNKITRIISSCDKIFTAIPDFIHEFGRIRLELGIRHRAIYPECEAANKIMSIYPYLYDAVVIPKNKYPFPVDIAIFDDKIGYLSFDKDNLTTIIIEDKEIAKAMENLFEFAYEELKRISKRTESIP